MTCNSLPKISIIICVLNMKDTLEKAIKSVICQNYPALELIIFDGGSTDGTVDIIKHYTSHIKLWRSDKDKGHADACNNALVFASGELILFLNADDELAVESLAIAAKAYRDHPTVEVISGEVIIIDQNISTHYYRPDELELTLYNALFKLPFINARFFKKEIFERLGKFKATLDDGSYYISNDRYFMSRLALYGIKTYIIPHVVYIYRAHAGSMTFGKTHTLKMNQEHIWLAEQLLDQQQLTNENHIIITKWLAQETAYRFCRLLMQRKVYSALQIAKKGIQKCHVSCWLQQLTSTFYRGVKNQVRKFQLGATKP